MQSNHRVAYTTERLCLVISVIFLFYEVLLQIQQRCSRRSDCPPSVGDEPRCDEQQQHGGIDASGIGSLPQPNEGICSQCMDGCGVFLWVCFLLILIEHVSA